MFKANFELAYFIGLVVTYAIRRYYGLVFRARGVRAQKYNNPLDRILAWAAELGFVAGIFYLFTDWLTFANYPPIHWLGWGGAAIFGFGIWLLWRAHKDLDRSWSPHIEIRPDQTLITEGVYHRIRHPMYAGYILLGIGQMMTLANWIAGPAFIVLFGILYVQRVSREEEMMLAKFGEEYQRYQERTGRLLPRLDPIERNQQKSLPTPTKE